MNPVFELKKLADNRLETLAMWISILTALCFCAAVGSVILILMTKFGNVDHTANALLVGWLSCAFLWFRYQVVAAHTRQASRVDELQALCNTQGRGGLLV